MSGKNLRGRHRREKLFEVTRQATVTYHFRVRATSALKARQTPTPPQARRFESMPTVGYARELAIASTSELYSQPGDEYAIAEAGA